MLEKNKTKQGLEFVKRFKHIKMVKMIPKLDLYLCVCVHVYMVHVSVHVYMVHVCVHVYTYMCTCVCTCMCTCLYMFVHGKNGKKRVTIKKHDEIALKMVQIDPKID